MLHFQKVRS